MTLEAQNIIWIFNTLQILNIPTKLENKALSPLRYLCKIVRFKNSRSCTPKSVCPLASNLPHLQRQRLSEFV